MPIEGNLDYALTRVYARHGQRLDEAAWRRLEVSRDLNLYLAAVRSTALADWVSAFDAEQDCHTVERALRAQWRRYVDTLTTWHPQVWQAWLAWLAWLPILSLLAQLARPERAPAWMLADPVCGPLTPGTPEERAAALADTVLAPLEPVLAARSSPGTAWSAHWQRLWPRSDAHAQHCLDVLLQTMKRHEQDLLHAQDSAEPLRSALANRIQRVLRLAAGTVIVTACHLTLLALDLERLRGGLARRRLFAGELGRP
jgi:hypothetical protein